MAPGCGNIPNRRRTPNISAQNALNSVKCRALNSEVKVLRNDCLTIAKETIMQKNLRPSYILFFLCGAALMLGLTALRGANTQPSPHVYELRIYHIHEGKADALRQRFGNYTDAIFKKHNMKGIGYWVPEDAPNSQKLFIYILEHPSRQEAEKNWAAFKADPEWQKVKAQSEANGALVDQEDSYFMDPTRYSALR